jgi:heparin/heparan-sulfate lyase
MSDGRHHNRYFVQTIAHNSITVGTGDIEGNGWTAVCGGQVSRPARAWLKRRGETVSADGLYTPRAGRLLAYQSHPRFDYAAGDATHSYSPDAVRSFTRQFLFIRPDLFVVFDRVVSVRAADPKRWYLHTMEEPRLLDGEREPDTSVHAQGHFLWKGTAGAASHRGSTLFWKTLLPRNAVIRAIGGPGHQFEVNGENYDMYDAWYRRLGQEFFDRIGLGMWRIEVEPLKKQAQDFFLHVLQATDRTVSIMAPAELIEGSDMVGARIRTGIDTVTVTFGVTGPVRGHITLQGDGDALDMDLAKDAIDDYEAWRTDPRYARWKKDPYLQAALTPMTRP